MQKAFIAIALALTLTCAFGAYNAQNWVKAPVQILADTDTNFTTAAGLNLGGLSTSDVNVIGSNVTDITDKTKNQTSTSWKLWTKAISTKDLSSSSNTSYAFNAPVIAGIQYGYVVGMSMENDTAGVPQVYMYQTKVSTGLALPRVVLTSNTNSSFYPIPLGGGMAAWKTAAFFYYASATGKVNYTSVTLGGSAVGKEFTFSTTWNDTSSQVSCDWGEALSSSQVFCAYTEAGVYKVAVVDFSAGTYVGQGPVAGAYGKTFSCAPYVTDKKYYGLFCNNVTVVNSTRYQTFYVSTNTTTDLVQLGNASTVANMSLQTYRSMHQYSQYLAIFYTNPSASNTEISYDIWDTYANVQWQTKKTILNLDLTNSTFDSYTIPQGGMYGLLTNVNRTSGVSSLIYVGQIMGASSLATVFGALMTIVAGLFLF